ncbi:autotransporter domain-containing protein [Serratia sp. T13T92]|uniref:autotransporter family protein n=1 Tax=Serratia sp. T13T92 TaxID=3397496 RepID=UPI0039E1500B
MYKKRVSLKLKNGNHKVEGFYFKRNTLSIALSLVFLSSVNAYAKEKISINDIVISDGQHFSNIVRVNDGEVLSYFENNGTVHPTGQETTFGVLNAGHIVNFINNTTGKIIAGTTMVNITESGSVENFINKGSIAGNSDVDPGIGVNIKGSVSRFHNQSSGYIRAPRAIDNGGIIESFINDGEISSGIANPGYAIFNHGIIKSLINNGSINGESAGVYNNSKGDIQEFINRGTINAKIGIYNDTGKLQDITNDGVISGEIYAIYNIGKARTQIITIQNNGEIIGGIESTGSGPIIIKGGSKDNPGVLTGLGGQLGQITAENSDVVFEPGKRGDYSYQQLNTNVSVGEGKAMLNRDGSTLLLDQAIKVDGNYVQENGASLVIGLQGNDSYGKLQVTGGADINNGAKVSLKPRNYVFVGGQRFLVLQAQTLNLGNIETDATGWMGKVTAEKIQSGGKDTLLIKLDELDTNTTISLGSGVLDKDVDGNGSMVVSAANSTAEINKTINVYGDYELNRDALLKFGVASDGSHGLLNVNGKAVLKEGANVQLAAKDYTFTAGQRFLVLRADSLDFTTLNSSAEGYAGSVQANGINTQKSGNMNTLVLTLVEDVAPVVPDIITDPVIEKPEVITEPVIEKPEVITEPVIEKPEVITEPVIEKPVQRIVATQQNAISMFKGLLSYQNGVDYALTELYNAALATSTQGTVDSANNAGAQLSPAANAAAAASAANLIGNAMHNAIERRTNNIADSSQYGLWIQPFGGFSRQSQRDAVSGYRATYGGLHLGADTQLYDNWHLGALYTYGSTNSRLQDNNEGSVVKLGSHGVMGYGGYHSDDWLFDVSAGALRHKYDSRRVIDFRGFNGNTRADFYGMEYLAAVNAGYMLNVGESTVLTPMLGLRYSSLRQDGYSESQGNGAGLQVNSLSTQSLRGSVGIKLEKKLSTDYGNLSPYVQLNWLHEYHDNQKNISGRFIADEVGETGFTTKLPSQVKDAGSLSLGASLVRKKNLSVNVGYNLDWASGYDNQAIGANLSYSF